MTVAVDPIVPVLDAPARYASWTPIILGALMATALSSILLAFGATIGLGVTSAAPTWRDASAALAILSGLYLIIQAVVSFGVGGYIAGRTRTASAASHVSEIEHRDGLHGLAAWALIARQSGWEARDNQDGDSVSRRSDDCRDDCRAQEFCWL